MAQLSVKLLKKLKLLDIEETVSVRVFGETKAAAKAAIAKIQASTAEVEPGKISDGKVIRS